MDADSTDMIITRNVNRLRNASGQALTDLANATGMTYTSIYRKNSGSSVWKASEVQLLAKHFGVEVGELFKKAS